MELYKKYPDFNYSCYTKLNIFNNIFNPNLINNPSNLDNILKDVIENNRITSLKDFYIKYPNFNYNFYKEIYKLENIYDIDVLENWIKIGVPEKRFCNEDFYNNHIGKSTVTNITEVLDDIKYLHNTPLTPGISLVIRAKNEELNVKMCIESVIDLVDEIIFVDNGSTDNTYKLMIDYAMKYDKIKLYKYNISVSRAGQAHKNAIETGDPNTLGLFYNWCLSKCTKYIVFKWDADFLCIRNNFVDLVNNYNLRNREDKLAIWFTGLTLFENNNNYYVNYRSFYDEFRIYSYKNNFKWYDGEICEYVDPYIKSVDKSLRFKYIYPLFYEMKRTSIDEFEGRSSMIDSRDINDFNILSSLKEDKLLNIIPINKNIIYHNNYFIENNPNPINNKILLVCPSLSIGGANSFILNMYTVMKMLGYFVNIYPINQDKYQIGSDKYTNIIESDVIKTFSDNYDIILFNSTLCIGEEELIKLSNKKIYFVTHSDVAYSNYFITLYHQYFNKIITVNNYTIEKLSNKLNIKKNKFVRLINYFDNKNQNRNLNKQQHNSFCIVSRFSEDKNIPMILFSLKKVFKTYNNYKCYFVGCGDTKEYDNYLINLAKDLNIFDNIVFTGYQKNVSQYFEMCDFSVLLSVSEGSPYAIIESISYGCPVIASNVGGNKELVNENSGILIDLDGLKELENNKIYIHNYNEHLTTIGYIELNNNNNKQLTPIMYPPNLIEDNKHINEDFFKTQKQIWINNVNKISYGIIKMIEEYLKFTPILPKEFINENYYIKTILELIN